ncbi:FAD-binding oxidoreductase [Sphingomonas sp. So64.6b]|uniref:NAD(P)/FAD-dependent oxidoreductase n=1 Tax=Sphingomonas sp. So64.6b TaxID=2997354 RepID=UPI0016020C4D|nr:FAD-binding oxidoreductase [Sphingomonas sp. So64.6b]QNA86315.1 FAD-binding oxidoreductase [Sphingomonas sp. So64.6b]
MSGLKHILVIGGGIAGASIAYEAAATHRVTLVETEAALGYHATGRSAAMYLAGYGNEVIRELTVASRSFFQEPPPGFAAAPILKRRGLLTIAEPGDEARLDGPEFRGQESLTPAHAQAVVPCLRADTIVAAMFDRDAADIDVDLLHQGYVRAARARGVTILSNENIVSAGRADGGWSIDTSAGPIAADVVINAGGAWADQIAGLFGAAPVGLSAMRRTAVLIDPPALAEFDRWPMVMTAKEDLYFKPDAGMLLVSPADETPTEPCDAQPDEWDVAVAIDRLQTISDVPVRHIAHRWAGLRTFAPDRAPVVGYDPALPDFFWFAGQGGYGLQMAPALARLGASLLNGAADLGGLDSLVHRLAPDRCGLAATS